MNSYRANLFAADEKWPWDHCALEDRHWFGGVTNESVPIPAWLRSLPDDRHQGIPISQTAQSPAPPRHTDASMQGHRRLTAHCTAANARLPAKVRNTTPSTRSIQCPNRKNPRRTSSRVKKTATNENHAIVPSAIHTP